MTIQAYQFAGGYGTVAIPNPPIISPRSPATTDIVSPDGNPYQIGQYWQNTLTNQIYFYTGGGLWDLIAGAGVGPIDALTGNSGGAIGPVAGNINVVGTGTTTVVGSGHTLTVTPTSGGFPVTPFVVGPVGVAGYQTIQSAATAAGAAGGGVVYIQGGSYTENVTIPANVSFIGSDEGVSITGTHTPPTTSASSLTFDNIVFISATDVLFSTAAGTTIINFNNCFFIITSGYVMNLLNWTGELLMDNCGEASTNDGVINNTGGSAIKLINVEVGAGTGKTMNVTSSSFLRIDTCNVNCPVSMSGSGSLIIQNGVKFANNVTIGGSLSGYIIQTVFNTGSAQALTYNSSGNTFLTDVSVNSSNNPAIGGTGTGTLTVSQISFISNAALANTLTIAYGSSLLGSTTVVGTTNVNITGSGVSTIGTGGTGAVNIGNATGNTAVTGSLTASTTLTATSGAITTTNGNFVASTAGTGLLFNPTTTSGTTTATLNGRCGKITITTPTINAGATFTFTITNSSVTSSSTQILYGLTGGTTGSAITIQSVTNSASTSAVVIQNASAVTNSTGSLVLTFLVIN